MEKRLSRFDRLREEKKKYPFLYSKKKSGLKDNILKSNKKNPVKDYSIIANAIKMLLSEDSKNG